LVKTVFRARFRPKALDRKAHVINAVGWAASDKWKSFSLLWQESGAGFYIMK